MASISTGLGLLIAGGLGAGASVASGVMGANAATTAAGEQVNAQEQALTQEEQNIQPYLTAGNTSISQLMTALSNGQYGPGSLATFQMPTLEQAQQYPGYQFTEQQGQKAILEGAAAGGGAITGGTLKALDTFATNNANTTYGNLFNEAAQTYQQNLAAQQQQYAQLLAPAQIGAGAAAGINTNIGNLMTGIGNSQAAGTVGSANAYSSMLSGLSSNTLQTLLLGQLLNQGGQQPINPNLEANQPFYGANLDSGVGPG